MSKRILSVGQCSFDGPAIASRLKSAFDATVVHADTADDARDDAAAEPFDLILINRILDATGEDGVALLRELKTGSAAETPIMLVSNYEDAQERAVRAGAQPGFGKNNLGETGMLAAVRAVLGAK